MIFKVSSSLFFFAVCLATATAATATAAGPEDPTSPASVVVTTPTTEKEFVVDLLVKAAGDGDRIEVVEDIHVVLVARSHHQVVVVSDALLTTGPHYEKPPCSNSDEKAVQIMGIDGMFCSPSCVDGPCPTDVPDGVTAVR
jgi:hypothetical protein